MIKELNQIAALKTQCSCIICDSNDCSMKKQSNQQSAYKECPSRQACLFINSIDKSRNDYNKFNKVSLIQDYDDEHLSDFYISQKMLNKHSKVSFKATSTESIDRVSSIELTNSSLIEPLNFNESAALSAEVMNLPQQTFDNSISCYKSKSNSTKISIDNLYEKIKEVYKACSCKVCDCLAGISQNNEICNCKPCECDDCKSLRKMQDFSHLKQQCFKYGSLKGNSCMKMATVISKEKCKCLPCACLKCNDIDPKSCNCKSCQCLECKAQNLSKLHTLMVAAVGDDTQLFSQCHCTPCNCIECIQNHCLSTNEMRHEMSTGLDRHPRCQCETCLNEACLPDNNTTCRCERSERLMRKPFQTHNTDYDIHSVEISQNENYDSDVIRDTISMFAEVPDRYSSYYTNSKECDSNGSKLSFKNIATDGKNASIHDIVNTMLNNECNLKNDIYYFNETSHKCFNCEKNEDLSGLTLSKPFKQNFKLNTFGKDSSKCKLIDCNSITDDTYTESFYKPVNCPQEAHVVKSNISVDKYPIPNFKKDVNKMYGIDSHYSDANSSNDEKLFYENNQRRAGIIKLANLTDSSNIESIASQSKSVKEMGFQTSNSNDTYMSSSTLFCCQNSSAISQGSECENVSPENSTYDSTKHKLQLTKAITKKRLSDTIKQNVQNYIKVDAMNVPSKCGSSKFYENNFVKSVYFNEHVLARSYKSYGRTTNFSNRNESLRRTQIDQNGGQTKNTVSGKLLNCTNVFGINQKNNQQEDLLKLQNSAYILTNYDIELDEDYKRLKRTIEDFSQELKKLLEKYENANKDFEKDFSSKLKFGNISSTTFDQKARYDDRHKSQMQKLRLDTTEVEDRVECMKFLNKRDIYSNENIPDIIENCNGALIEFDYDSSKQLQMNNVNTKNTKMTSLSDYYCEGNHEFMEENDNMNKTKKFTRTSKTCSTATGQNKIFKQKITMYAVTKTSNAFNQVAGIVNKFENLLPESKKPPMTKRHVPGKIVCKPELQVNPAIPSDFVPVIDSKSKSKLQNLSENIWLSNNKSQEHIAYLTKKEPDTDTSNTISSDSSHKVQIDLQESPGYQANVNTEKIKLYPKLNYISSNEKVYDIDENCDAPKIESNYVTDLKECSTCQMGGNVKSVQLLNQFQFVEYSLIPNENVSDAIEHSDGAIIEFNYNSSKQLYSNSFDNQKSDYRTFDNSMHFESNLNPIDEEYELAVDRIYSSQQASIKKYIKTSKRCLTDSKLLRSIVMKHPMKTTPPKIVQFEQTAQRNDSGDIDYAQIKIQDKYEDENISNSVNSFAEAIHID